jgi:hypothetical protein
MLATTSRATVPPPVTPAPTTITVANDSKLQITALSGAENWKVWKMRIMDWLDEKDMVDIIKTVKPSISSTSPAVTADDIKLWENQNKKALANIRRNVTDSIADDLVHLTSSLLGDNSLGIACLKDQMSMNTYRRCDNTSMILEASTPTMPPLLTGLSLSLHRSLIHGIFLSKHYSTT